MGDSGKYFSTFTFVGGLWENRFVHTYFTTYALPSCRSSLALREVLEKKRHRNLVKCAR